MTAELRPKPSRGLCRTTAVVLVGRLDSSASVAAGDTLRSLASASEGDGFFDWAVQHANGADAPVPLSRICARGSFAALCRTTGSSFFRHVASERLLESGMKDVFLSHAHKDKDSVVLPFARELKRVRLFWIDAHRWKPL